MNSQIDKEKSKKQDSELSLYPIDMSPLLTQCQFSLDDEGTPYQINPRGHHPAIIAQSALAQWNQYLATSSEKYRAAFLAQAYWLADNASRIDDDASGWPISFPHSEGQMKGPRLSAVVQGNSISVLIRAYQLTYQEAFLDVACRAVRTFERDILDGGINTPMASNCIFFEQHAVYPATHSLEGMAFALLGLHDYLTLVDDKKIFALARSAHLSLHRFLKEFDLGFWTRTDLLHRQLSSPIHLVLQADLLSALATVFACEHCSKRSLIWQKYQLQPFMKIRYLFAHWQAISRFALLKPIRAKYFSASQISKPLRVCIPIYAFPVIGGTRAVVANIAQTMAEAWQIDYLTQMLGPNTENFTIHTFGTARMKPWQFPLVWLYFFAGLKKLLWLLHHKIAYHIILPQDGVFTAAFAAIAGKLAGVRVVCMDHGNLTLYNSQIYREERLQALADMRWIERVCLRPLLIAYWPSLNLLARMAAPLIDHFLIPGIEGDGIEDMCERLKIPLSRITRFNSMVNVEQYGTADGLLRACIREKYEIPANATVVSMVCRLAVEKGLEVALESIDQALSQIPPEQAKRVVVMIAGNGPLRTHLEKEILSRGLSNSCKLMGEIAEPDVISLLNVSDIFFYTSIRGACMSMAVLEAMAAGCAVIASTRPLSNLHLLSNGRGIAIPAGDVGQTSQALVRLLNDRELCHQMGRLARSYIATHHNAEVFRRVLMRSTYWSSLDELFPSRIKSEV